MSILTASNPLILALVLSLYLVSKESYRILKVKKILICSMVGHFTLYFFKVKIKRALNREVKLQLKFREFRYLSQKFSKFKEKNKKGCYESR